jgi:hypothetical protein
MHPALFVERRHRLGSGELSAGGPHHQEGHIRINYAGRFDPLAADVGLGDNPVGAVRAIGCDRGPCRFRRRIAAGRVGEHPTPPLPVLAGEDDAGLVGVLGRGRGRIDWRHHSDQCRGGARSARLDDAAAP